MTEQARRQRGIVNRDVRPFEEEERAVTAHPPAGEVRRPDATPRAAAQPFSWGEDHSNPAALRAEPDSLASGPDTSLAERLLNVLDADLEPRHWQRLQEWLLKRGVTLEEIEAAADAPTPVANSEECAEKFFDDMYPSTCWSGANAAAQFLMSGNSNDDPAEEGVERDTEPSRPGSSRCGASNKEPPSPSCESHKEEKSSENRARGCRGNSQRTPAFPHPAVRQRGGPSSVGNS